MKFLTAISIALKALLSLLVISTAVLLIGTQLQLPVQYQLFSVLSGSMEPNIPVGSIVVTRPTNAFRIGDIVTYKTDNTPVTHRISAINPQESEALFQTKGDANASTDPELVPRSDIIGKVWLSVPFVGYATEWIRSPVGFVAMIIIPATIIIYEELRSMGKAFLRFAKSKKVMSILLAGTVIGFTSATNAFVSDIEVGENNSFSASDDFGEEVGLFQSNGYTCEGGATELNHQLGNITTTIGISSIFIDVYIENATANTSYDLWVNQNPGECPLSAPSIDSALVTDPNGNAVDSFTIDKVTEAENFWVSLVGGSDVLRSISVD